MAGLMGLLSDPRMADIATGLLSQSGYTAMPTTLGQAFGGAMQFANQRELERTKLEAARTEMAQQKQRQQTMSEIQGLLQPTNQPYSRVTPGTGPLAQPQSEMGVKSVIPAQTTEGQSKMLGLLSQVAPEAMTQGLLAQMFKQQEPARVSTGLNTFRSFFPNTDITTPEGRQQYFEFQQQQDPQAGFDQTMKELQAEALVIQLENSRDERNRAEVDENRDRATTQRGITTDIRKLLELRELNDRLEGTILETGMPVSEGFKLFAQGKNALKIAFGIGDDEAGNLLADYNTFNKYATDFVVGSLDRLNGSGAITDAKFNALIDSNASIGVSPETNRQIIALNLEELLGGAEIDDYRISDELRREAQAAMLGVKGSRTEPNQSAQELTGSMLGTEAPGLLDRASNAVSGAVDAATGAMPSEADIDAEIDTLLREIEQLRSRR